MVAARRRFEDHKEGNRFVILPPEHPSALNGRTLFMKRIGASADQQRLLKSGQHSRKIGSHVTKGAWKGMPIYTLTLEERATCPRSCEHWLDCYGNKMNWSVRVQADAGLIGCLRSEVHALAEKYPAGFVVRLHVLGDFFSPEYVQFWLSMLAAYAELRIFGYTAWPPSTAIGQKISRGHGLFWKRFRIRFSNASERRFRTITIDHQRDAGDAIVCPAQTGRTDCCGTCSLCWATDKDIAFMRH